MTSERVHAMADAPKLNSATDATAGRYATLSWVAVLALVMAVLFVVLLVLMAYEAYTAGQPLFQWWLFVFPAAGIFLAFIARREVRNSEGARTDKGLAGVAWWACVVAGACYFAYLLANDFAVRAESERALTQWSDKLAVAKPTDVSDKATWEAFEKTLDPGSPVAGNPQAAHAPQVAVPYGQFRNTPLLLIWSRNRDAGATFTPNGLRNWELATDGKLTCEAAATLSCPEGDFPVSVVLRGVIADPKTKVRTWQVLPAPQFKFVDVDTAPRTKYGWMIEDLQFEAMNNAAQFFDLMSMPPPFGPSLAVDRFMGPHRSADHTQNLTNPEGLAFRMMLTGPTALIAGPTDPTEVPAADRSPHFFTRTTGEPLTDAPFTRPDGQKLDRGLSTVRKVWEQPTLSLIAPAFKSRLRQPDLAPRFPLIDTSDPARVVVKVPIDFHPRRDEFPSKTFTSGYLVLVCDDPIAVKGLTAAREEAKAGRDKPKADRPAAASPFRLRVVRFETDLLPLVAPEAQQGGPPGG